MVQELQNKNGSVSQEVEPSFRISATRIAITICALILFSVFVALGTWQVYRLQWKLALIDRIEQRVHTAAVAAPTMNTWSEVNAANDEYRHVYASGVLLHGSSTKSQAVTELGAGYWLLTPLRAADGTSIFINRGYITEAQNQAIFPNHETVNVSLLGDDKPVQIAGLLRISEPGGGFLRKNDASGDRWYSRDTQAIAESRGLANVAPYFIDAKVDRGNPTSSSDTSFIRPVAGLTVISFHNSHMVYALTWYALALMVAGAAFWVRREDRKASKI